MSFIQQFLRYDTSYSNYLAGFAPDVHEQTRTLHPSCHAAPVAVTRDSRLTRLSGLVSVKAESEAEETRGRSKRFQENWTKEAKTAVLTPPFWMPFNF